MKVFSRVPLRAAALGRRGRWATRPRPPASGGAPAGLPRFMRAPAASDPARPHIRDDAAAHEEALDAGAHAFTRGDEVVLGPTVGTADGPTREQAVRHEQVHAAQVQYGKATGHRAPESALESEAHALATAGGGGPVQQGADAHAVHGLFFDEEEQEDSSASDDSSESDSSHLGMERSIWDHLLEALTGIVELGPVDAYAAGFGEDSEAAAVFAAQFDDLWMQNAARHGVWQARLAWKYGADQAESIGDAHEGGSPNALDSWIDQHNNAVARGIGEAAGSLDEIPDLIQAAMDDGRLITDPNDRRVPEALRPPTSQPEPAPAPEPAP